MYCYLLLLASYCVIFIAYAKQLIYTEAFRLGLFFFLCIPVRLLLAYFGYLKLQFMPYLAMGISFGFFYKFIAEERKLARGEKLSPGAFGGDAFWHRERLTHSVLFATYSTMAFAGHEQAYAVLLADVAFGFLNKLIAL